MLCALFKQKATGAPNDMRRVHRPSYGSWPYQTALPSVTRALIATKIEMGLQSCKNHHVSVIFNGLDGIASCHAQPMLHGFDSLSRMPIHSFDLTTFFGLDSQGSSSPKLM
eukprot:1253524-Amphidinium_carterae.1